MHGAGVLADRGRYADAESTVKRAMELWGQSTDLLAGPNRASAMNVLKARLYERKQDEQRAEMDKFYGEKGEIGWGSQIRSYVLQPYQMVKDLRTGISTSDTQGVLDGDLDRFVNAWLRAGCPRHRNKDIQMEE